MSEEYNGHTNWATWFVASELSNNEEWHKQAQRLVRAEGSAEEFRELAQKSLFPSPGVTSYGEMSRSEFDDVDWDDLRDTFVG